MSVVIFFHKALILRMIQLLTNQDYHLSLPDFPKNSANLEELGAGNIWWSLQSVEFEFHQ